MKPDTKAQRAATAFTDAPPSLPTPDGRAVLMAANTQPPERLLTRDEAAEVLRATPRFIRRLIAERRIRFVYVGRTPHIPESAIADYIDRAHRSPGHRPLAWRKGG